MYCNDCEADHLDVFTLSVRIAEDHKNGHDKEFVSDQAWRKELSSKNLQDRLWAHLLPQNHQCDKNCIDDWHANVEKYDFWLGIKVLVSGTEVSYQNKKSPLGGIYGNAVEEIFIGPLDSTGRLTIADCLELQRRIDPSECGRHQIRVTIQVKNYSPKVSLPFQKTVLMVQQRYQK